MIRSLLLGFCDFFFDRRRRNERERHRHAASRSKPHAACFLDIILDDCEHIESDTSELECFYYTFLVSAKRALRNVFGRPLRASLFADFACYRPEFAGRMVVPALASLAMEDRNACDYAQASHRELLIRAGALDPSCEVHLDVRLHVILIFLHVLHVNLFTCKDFLHIANLHVNSLIRK